MLVSALWSMFAGTILVVFSPAILAHWVDKDISFPPELPLYMLLTYVLLCVSQCVAMLVNGLGRLKLQSLVAPISAITNLLLSITLGKAIGIQGVTLATSVSILLFSIFLVGGDSILMMKRMSLK